MIPSRMLVVCATACLMFWTWTISATSRPTSVQVKHQHVSDGKVIYPYRAVVVEPGVNAALVPVIHNFIANLPASWHIQVFHTETNKKFLETSALQRHISAGKVSLHLIGPPFNRLEDMTYDSYSVFLASASFWNRIPAEQVLIFQYDSVICSASEHSIEDFFGYDYVGAPWSLWQGPRGHVGNGGLSLRSKTKALAAIAHKEFTVGMHEDSWFVDTIREMGGRLAPAFVASQFAMESIFAERPWAVHKPWTGRSKEEKQRLLRYCPEAGMLFPLEQLPPSETPREDMSVCPSVFFALIWIQECLFPVVLWCGTLGVVIRTEKMLSPAANVAVLAVLNVFTYLYLFVS